ncbi:MAG: hypothetical protein ACRC37_02880 [Lentisphaeria bacterium]
MIILSWCLLLSILGAVLEPLLSYQFLQFFPILIIWFYLLLQWRWSIVWPFIFISGFMSDVLIGHSIYFYLPFGLLFIPLVVNRWRLRGDCSIYLFNIMPLSIIGFVAAVVRWLIFLQGNWSFEKFLFSILYVFGSTIVCALFGCLQLYMLDSIAEKLNLPRLKDIRVRQ